MPNINDYIRNIGILSSGLTSPSKNAPSQYGNRKRQYLGEETTLFAKTMAKYASDYFSAEAQGLDPDDATAWKTVSMRMADVIKPSAAMRKHIDDYKNILIGDEAIDYIRPGTKFVTMGSTWLAINPENISSAYGTGLVQKCRAAWNHLDFYGNILSEPMCVEEDIASASAPDNQDYIRITTGHYILRCQYNEYTKQLDNNSRLIFGRKAFYITGFTDFLQEFTESDDNSVRMIEFNGRYEEPNREIDDMENHIAGGLEFSWEVNISGNTTMRAGTTTTLTANSVRNGETAISSTEYPISYLWESSNEAVATVDASGVVTAVASGQCVIACRLEQNTAKTAQIALTVTESGTGTSVSFKGTVDAEIRAYETSTYTAVIYENGIEQEEKSVTWEFSGADEACYKTVINGNSVTVTCYGGSNTPLTIKASYGAVNASTSVSLVGM